MKQGACGRVANRHELASAIERVRDAAAGGGAIAPARIAKTISKAIELWRSRDYQRRRDAVSRIAANLDLSSRSLDESLDALLEPFSAASLNSFAARVPAGLARERAPGFVAGFVMAGNVVGAGLHEVVIALLAGAGMLIKTASAEPIFFEEFAHTIAEADPEIASRIAVANWSRDHRDLTDELTQRCDCIAAYGDDSSINAIRAGANFIGFGSRVSAAAIATRKMPFAEVKRVAALVARDVALFEQLGCLSPHHIFVVDRDENAAANFASELAAALESLAAAMPPAKIPLHDAALILSVRENARWRRIAGEPVELLEGRSLSWTVVFDRTASFCVSPGFRTVFVSGVRDATELCARLSPASGKLEAIELAGSDVQVSELSEVCSGLGVSYLAETGRMQSPPLDWRHGGGRFIDLMVVAR